MAKTLSLGCGRCRKRFRFASEFVVMHPDPSEVHPGWHGVLILPVVLCPHCGAEDEFTVSAGARFGLMGGVLRSLFDDAPEESGIARGEVRLWDGTVARSATHALAHLRGLAEQRPGEAEPWRRLGNFCLRCRRLDEAEKAFRKALDVDRDDVESCHSLIDLLLDAERIPEAVPLFHRALSAVPVARWSPPEMRREIARQVLGHLSDLMEAIGKKFSLEVVWRYDGPEDRPAFVWSRAELGEPWERLIDVLVSERTVRVQLSTPLPADKTSILRRLLDSGEPVEEALGKPHPGETVPSPLSATTSAAAEQPSALPGASPPRGLTAAATRTTPRVGRNEPCPCGSGKKSKKCCGR